jgi:hypothetical protein
MSKKQLPLTDEDSDAGYADKSDANAEDREEIESLGLGDLSNAGFERLKEHKKPKTEKRKFVGFGSQDE